MVVEVVEREWRWWRERVEVVVVAEREWWRRGHADVEDRKMVALTVFSLRICKIPGSDEAKVMMSWECRKVIQTHCWREGDAAIIGRRWWHAEGTVQAA